MSNPPCPYECTERVDHYHEKWDEELVGATACNPEDDCEYDGEHITRCYSPSVKAQPARRSELMFALSTVEALIRAAIADERAGIDPDPTWSLPYPDGCR